MSDINEVRERLAHDIALVDDDYPRVWSDDVRTLLADHARLQAEAARYRHLKGHHLLLWRDKATGAPTTCSFDFEAPGHNIDAAIDAAMAVRP